MALQDILVHLDSGRVCQGRLDAAIGLARKHRSHLTGLYVYSSPRQKRSDPKPEFVREEFLQRTGEAEVPAKWIGVDLAFSKVGIEEMVGYYASFTDLVVSGLPSPETRDLTFPSAGLERLIHGCGRPVLLLPGTGTFDPLGERIMVAWKAGPKSTRALHDGMPFLQTARYLSMVTTGAVKSFSEERALLSEHLARYQIVARLEQIPSGELQTGETLLSLIADDCIDLVIVGVHIQLRRGALRMGEVGDHLLKHIRVPILFSH